MDSSSEGGCDQVGSDLSIILITVVQLIFFVYFYEYIAWYTKGPNGEIVRLSLLTDDYATWLPFPIVGSILVIVSSTILVFWNNTWFRQIVWIGYNLIGITMIVSLLVIFPFDFGVIPNANMAEIVPKVVIGFLIFMGVFYTGSAVVLSVRFARKLRDSTHNGPQSAPLS